MKARTMVMAVLLCGMGILAIGCNGPKWTCRQVSEQLAASDNAAIRPVPRLESSWWVERHNAVNSRVQQGNVDLMLIGDSITHGWENHPDLWQTYFGRWNTVNAGFSGDRTQHVLWRLDNGNIDGISPRVVMLMIGTNNSNGNDHTAEEIAEGIAAIVCKLRAKLPESKVVILGIFPRGSKEQRNDKTADAVYNPQWSKNDKANELVSRLADGKHIFYLNINHVFLDDQGVLRRDIMPDLLHLSKEGYKRWGQAVLPTLDKLMAE
ncbi:MAG: GDSL family lipase [Planctomycetes bacterium]|jgi:beta-glucosidase|nr:GDSL family lipase [Planctomycetota bacterium]